jgi:hypothetical protein
MTAATPVHPPLRSHWRGMAGGFALAVLGTAFAALASHDNAVVFDAVLLAAIAWVYIGFAIAEGRPSSIAVQIVAGAAFLLAACYGALWDSPQMLGAGFLAHGIWDCVHHNDHGPTHVRAWYPPFCAVADLVLAVPLLVGWV